MNDLVVIVVDTMATLIDVALREIVYAMSMLTDLLWVLVGFVLAIVWEKIKDWCRFRTLMKWIMEELQEIKNSLESRLANLPAQLSEKVKVAQGGILNLNPSELSALPIDIRMPYPTSAWQTFIASGYASKLDDEAYKTLREAYTSIEGTNFIAGLATFQLVGASSSVFVEATRKALSQALLSQPLLTIVLALPIINAALKKLDETRTKSGSLRSFARFILK